MKNGELSDDGEHCNTIMEAIDARETMEINGGDDVDEDFLQSHSLPDRTFSKRLLLLVDSLRKWMTPLHACLKGFYAL